MDGAGTVAAALWALLVLLLQADVVDGVDGVQVVEEVDEVDEVDEVVEAFADEVEVAVDKEEGVREGDEDVGLLLLCCTS